MSQDQIVVRIRVSPSTKANEVIQALEQLGYQVVDESESDPQIDRINEAIRQRDKKPLTPVEKLVLAQMLLGRNNREIAEALNKSPSVTKWHMSNIYGKTGAAGAEQVRRLAEGKGYKRREDDSSKVACAA